MTVQVRVVSGDLTRTVPVDAIVTMINSSGMWFGGVDQAIKRVAGNMYHQQASQQRLYDGQSLVASGIARHHGSFRDVIFVVDDLRQPLSGLVSAALEVAKTRRYAKIAFPAMRTGVMAGVFESPQEAIQQAALAIRLFKEQNPNLDMEIYFVVYKDLGVQHALVNSIQN